ncbi:uncharacterized protein BDZ99DRAFT_184501 [Mytilinidion resinicola]|uniref:Alpha/beta-hydrolase n=1 Tax=Mytilinidion resinicola TaxID=574789 RepID=A0A6A6Z3E8_9PEZI|nr:uncharacterized protein BDZ99DRAFT_184501 [Mytilinidion resinicola]KAF2814777.1 hypothetical protein BDZ99DRAFT_184501 [Mytilinidion resinicola]
MAVPEPAFTFTIPSIHDDTPLDCRIYHPAALLDAPAAGSHRWTKSGTVIAHPYAPLGGSYDDHVVGMVADELLKEGFVVGTFNFRGAHHSKGRTSWTGKPELDDYISFAGFLIHYLDLLQLQSPPPVSKPTMPSASRSPISPEKLPSKPKENLPEKALILLAGYSYGSLITKHLPPTAQLLSLFSRPTPGSAAAEILLRAHTLAAQFNRELAAAHQSAKKHSHEPHPVKMGGEETPPDLRRSSREVRRSSEHARSFELPHGMRSLSLRRKRGASQQSQENGLAVIESRVSASTAPSPAPNLKQRESENDARPATSTAYLLISPVPPPLSTLMIPGIGHKFWNKHKEHQGETIVQRPTLALFGDADGFVAVRKYRQWAAKLAAEPGSRFEYGEVGGAGHFWHEEGVEGKLRENVQRWVGGLGRD